MHVWAIVVAGGSGTRFGGPKQERLLGGRTILDWSLSAARANADVVVAVVRPERADEDEPGADRTTAGGATRAESVRAGLGAIADASDDDVVLVHDAARPFAGADVFARVVAAVVAGADGAIPGIAVADTVKIVDDDGRVVATPDRARLRAVQTPQAFRVGVLRRAHVARPEATDDAALVEQLGGCVVVVEGDPRNRKITTPDDLAWAEHHLEERRA